MWSITEVNTKDPDRFKVMIPVNDQLVTIAKKSKNLLFPEKDPLDPAGDRCKYFIRDRTTLFCNLID